MARILDDDGMGDYVEMPHGFTSEQWAWIRANHPRKQWGIRVVVLPGDIHYGRIERFFTALLFGSPAWTKARRIPYPSRETSDLDD